MAPYVVDGAMDGSSFLAYVEQTAYSPDLNPIEQAFSKLKAALRKGATRTVDALIKLIGNLVKSFAPDECANYFRHAGYAT